MEVGVVTIKVRPDLDGFREKVEREIQKLRPVKVKVDPDVQTAGLKQKIEAAGKGAKATINVDADTAKARAQIAALKKYGLAHRFKTNVSAPDDSRRSLTTLTREMIFVQREFDRLRVKQQLYKEHAKGMFSRSADEAKAFGSRLRDLNSQFMKAAANARDIPSDFSKRMKSAVSERGVITPFVNGITRIRSALRGAGDDADSFGERTRRAVKKATKGPKTPGVVKHQSKKILGLSRMGWIVSAVASIAAPAIGLVSGALAALPSLGFAAGAALGVVVLGFDGIKNAAKAAAPGINEIKSALSEKFEDRLTPQFEDINQLLLDTKPNLVNVADGISDFTAGMVKAATKGKGLDNTREILDNTAGLFSKLSGFSEDFTAGLLEAGAAGSRSFDRLSQGLNNYGRNFRNAVEEMSADGSLQKSIESTYSILGSFGDNIGKWVKTGVRELPKMEDAAKRLFDGLGDGVNDVIPTLTGLFNGVAPFVGELAKQVGDIVKQMKLGPVFEDLGSGLTGATKGAGELLKELSPIAGVLGDIAGKTVKFAGEGLGDALSGLARQIRKHAPTLEEDSKRIREAFDRIAGTGSEGESKDPGKQFSWLDLTPITAQIAAGGKLLNVTADMLEDGSKNWEKTKPQFVQDMRDMGQEWKNLFTKPLETIKNKGMQAAKDMYYTSGLEGGVDFIQRKLKEAQDFKASGQPYQTKIAGVGLGDGLVQGIEEGFSQRWETFKAGLSEKFTTGLADTQAGIGGAWDGLSETWAAQWDGISLSLTEKWNTLKTDASTGWEEAKASMSTVWDGLSENWSVSWETVRTNLMSKWDEIRNSATVGWEEAKFSLSTVWDGVSEGWSGAWSGVQATLSGIWSSIQAEASGVFAGIGSVVAGAWANVESTTASAWASAQATVSGAWASMVSAVQSGCDQAVSFAQQLPGRVQGALGNLGGLLFSSGQSLVQGFVNGIQSMIDEVSGAASKVVAAARAFFPFSPAKKGPFSGRGYTTWSGKALATDFASGMLSERARVAVAAGDLVGGARAAFEDLPVMMRKITDDFNAAFESNAVEKVEAPVRAANARKIKQAIEQYDKQVENAYKNHDKAMKAYDEKVNKSKNSKAPELKMPEFKMPELETPDYTKIDRSFQAYYIDGVKDILNKRVDSLVVGEDLAGKAKAAALGAVAQIRKVVGDHGILQTIEGNVNDPNFGDRVRKALEDAKIGDIPVNFVVSNLEQLKSDLGMGDGVVSRALDAMMKFNANDNDANRERWQSKADEKKPEIHYHVKDIDEAMRLEDIRRRREMMKFN